VILLGDLFLVVNSYGYISSALFDDKEADKKARKISGVVVKAPIVADYRVCTDRSTE